MTPEFLFFANLTLALRLRWLLVDQPPRPRAWLWKSAIEVVALFALLPLDLGAIGAAATSVAMNLAAIVCDRRVRDRNAAHLLLGAVHLVALSVWLGPALSASFHPWVEATSEILAEWSAVGEAFAHVLHPRTMLLLGGLFLVANEANLLIRWLLARLQFRPDAHAGLDANEFARGRVIGLLERTLIYFFVLNGQYGAVGFTLAAKGFTRFKELEKRSFAEYVLIGTLVSSGLAMLIASAVKRLL